MNNIWQLQDAKSKFSELVDKAVSHGYQIVTRRGKKTVVVLPFDEYQRLTRGGSSLVQFLLSSPLPDSGISTERMGDLPRDIGIES